MADAYDYFREHAIAAVRKARVLPPGWPKRKQRTVARVYHLLSKEAALRPNIVTSMMFARHGGSSGKSAADLSAQPVGARPMQIRSAAIPRE
ncbi:hypothetical protein LRP30_34970 [Bradyrhizobium sp. C-145]|nr:hypothetical protein [Bradyrhizobium sp. C-145]UQR61949.1 hypothetical protein LRP30_34970 [Bradyrhizobium sp. C-145]